jgi:hypothetical protein
MRTWSFYDQVSGSFSGRRFRALNDRALDANTPDGLVPLEGTFDRLSQRVDVQTGKVVDFQPPQPDADHEWNAESRRWVKKAAVLAAERADKQARTRIAELEASQARAIREHTLGDATAIDRLRTIDDEIKTLRSDILPTRG